MKQGLIGLLCVLPSMLFADSLHEQFAQLIEAPEKTLNCFEADSAYRFCLKNLPNQGIVVVDQQGNEAYRPYYFDNWPDEPKNGLYRIRQGDKIGFAEAKTGKVVIEANYDCAYPFENGKAHVGIGCQRETDGEHSWWVGGHWVWIDLQGNRITAHPASWDLRLFEFYLTNHFIYTISINMINLLIINCYC
ncbi:WG repeat-containing protein [Providencia stuartii]|nr:WG repeat-containing protein [Providencia stuartii]